MTRPLPCLRHALVALLALFCLGARGAETRPNIVFILADDLGWSDTTLFGTTKYYKTPNLERLAKRGMLFTHAYSASPLCSPTRSSILTGLHPARTGITTPNCHLPQVVLKATPGEKTAPGNKAAGPNPVTRLNTSYTTLAETLKGAGYATAHFGKWHLGPEPYSPLQQGFDVDVPHWAGPGPAGSYVAPWKFKDFDADPGEPNQHIEDRMAKEAVTWMTKHKDGPFFLNYWMFSVHAPFDAKKALIEKYKATANPADPQHCPTYAAMVESMDDAVGTLLDSLDKLGIAERTMVVFYSDNGGNMYSQVNGSDPTSNAPLRGGKATVYEGGIRVPCIVSMPGVVAAGSRNDATIQSTDFFPTFLELLSMKPEAEQRFDGVSIVPALKGQAFERSAMFTYFPHNPPVPDWLPPSVVVHQGDWKLIRLFYQGENGAHRWKLYNLKEDLGERNDLAAKQPERVKAMDALIEKFLTDTNAVQPIPNPSFDPALYHPEQEGIGKMRDEAGPAPKAKAKAAAATSEKDDPKLQGWKARACTAVASEGIVTVTGKGDAPFLGFAAGRMEGATTVAFKVKSEHGGAGKVEWLPSPAAADMAKSVEYRITGGDWQEIVVTLPAEGTLGILRLYLPAQKDPVQIDYVDVKPANGKGQRTDF